MGREMGYRPGGAAALPSLDCDMRAGREHDWERTAMKAFTIAAITLVWLTMPASAQVNEKRHQGDAKKTEQKRPAVDEKAYKAALERIPEPKEKYDPWGVARPAEPAKKSK
jgi:hypothetical protein